MITFRPIAERDVLAAEALIQASFNSANSFEAILRRYRGLQPDGWLLGLEGEQPVAMVGITDYGTFAYIGMMGVHPDHQGRGIGQAMMEYALDWIDTRKVPITLLDATQAGERLYRKLGFRPAGNRPMLDYRRPAPPAPPTHPLTPITPEMLDELVAFDTACFGADRRRVLAAMIADPTERGLLIRNAQGTLTGYLFAGLRHIGPWMATSAEAAEHLMRGALQVMGGMTVVVVTPFDNKPAIDLLVRLGFMSLRSCLHMQRGDGEHPGQIDTLYGQASYAIG